jgi:hypothetical protein
MTNLHETWYSAVTETYRGSAEDNTDIQLRECVRTFSPIKDEELEGLFGFKRWETKEVETKELKKLIRLQGRQNRENGIENPLNWDKCKVQVLAELQSN